MIGARFYGITKSLSGNKNEIAQFFHHAGDVLVPPVVAHARPRWELPISLLILSGSSS